MNPCYDNAFWLRAVRQYFAAHLARYQLALLVLDATLTLMEVHHAAVPTRQP